MTLSSSSSTVIVTKGRKLKSWKVETIKNACHDIRAFVCACVCVWSPAKQPKVISIWPSAAAAAAAAATVVRQCHSWSLRWQLHFTSLHFTSLHSQAIDWKGCSGVFNFHFTVCVSVSVWSCCAVCDRGKSTRLHSLSNSCCCRTMNVVPIAHHSRWHWHRCCCCCCWSDFPKKKMMKWFAFANFFYLSVCFSALLQLHCLFALSFSEIFFCVALFRWLSSETLLLLLSIYLTSWSSPANWPRLSTGSSSSSSSTISSRHLN